MLRCPFSLQRMIRVTDGGQVLYVAEKRAPQRFPKPASADLFGDVARNFQIFDPLDFIATLASIPRRPAASAPKPTAGVHAPCRARSAHRARSDAPAPGVAHMFAMDMGEQVLVSIRIHLYGSTAAGVVVREEPAWQAWLGETFSSEQSPPKRALKHDL